MKFRFTANVMFEAINIDDAFRILEKHFRNLSEGNDTEDDLVGNLEIYPIKEEKK
jgi:hypothetical protein